MELEEAVRARIAGNEEELRRRQALWRKIVEESCEGGEDRAKRYLNDKAETIAADFSERVKGLEASFL